MRGRLWGVQPFLLSPCCQSSWTSHWDFVPEVACCKIGLLTLVTPHGILRNEEDNALELLIVMLETLESIQQMPSLLL